MLYALAIAALALWPSDAHAGPLVPIIMAAAAAAAGGTSVVAAVVSAAGPIGGTFLIQHLWKRSQCRQ